MSEASAGGLKEAIALVSGDRVFSSLKHEAGVHRVPSPRSLTKKGQEDEGQEDGVVSRPIYLSAIFLSSILHHSSYIIHPPSHVPTDAAKRS